ncbi:uncharacterized protein LOC143554528 [Bidens hawaiensis]|uniref:uncharacterized protein LOC143554528 n=1 Tax=Bidens hawaiensis TaxID=980011 RepID=UPI0040493EFD
MDDELEKHIINNLKTMLDSNNYLFQAYRMVIDCFDENPQLDLKLRIIGTRPNDARQYNLPSSSEVAALIVGDIGDAVDNRDIIVTKQFGSLKRISELHPSYTPLQYPLFHPFGEDGYQVNILHKNVSSSSTAARKKVTMQVKRFLTDTTLKSEDRPDILCRVFKLKLDAMIKLVKDKSLFGKVQAVVYTIEFQKRGLPHAHICIFMHPGSKIHNPQDVDKFISAEIPNKDGDPDLYKLVSDHMIHGSCGDANPKCTCMVNKKRSKSFPKIFNDGTTVDSQGFPIYKRRDNGQYVVKSDIMMDNRTVVPYNKTLLKQFQAHINVEWCNQNESIKYLFKYINKGPYQATISLVQNNNGDNTDPNLDEIKAFYDCRYVSACEATWRIFSFDVHYRIPSVMRLAFHLPGEQQVIYGANEDIGDILNKTTNASSMFTGWFECNKNHNLAKTLTYAKFPTKYVWKKQLHKWEPRLKGFAIGRVHVVSPAFDEAYYLRILLNKVKGPECFEDIRTVDGVVYETFRDACYKRGLLDDDKEYIEAIEEASGVYFVSGYGGTGITYLWKTLSSSIRSKGQVVLNVVSSGIASLLLDGGRTAHSRFLIPINLTEDSIFPVKGNTDVYELLKKTSLIIWDEAPMIHKHAFEALDMTLNDVMNGDSGNSSEAVFGGKVVVFGGDFRQILPVVTNVGCRSSDIQNIREFADWLLDIGQGNVGGPNDGEAVIDIHEDLLILNSDRALLAPLNEVVQKINERMLDLFPGEEVEYLSSDSLAECEDLSEDFDPQLYSPDLLKGPVTGMPNHRLVLKVGVPIMILRNINHKKGLCNGTCLPVVSLGRRVIEAKVVSGMNIGYRTLISRVSLTPTDKNLPFRLKRRQFPISVCFAMTINKSQGQSLSRVGLYLKDPVFSHGRLYVALSRVKTKDGIKCVRKSDFVLVEVFKMLMMV